MVNVRVSWKLAVILVAYHLHGQTGRFTVWVNNSQSSGLVKFRPGIAFTICTTQFHLPENCQEGLKLVSKMALKKCNTNFRLEYSIRKNRTTILYFPLLSEMSVGKAQRVSCVIYFPTRISRKIFLNGK